MSNQQNILSSPIEYLKGVGPQKADILKKEIGVFTFRDLVMKFPFRYVDKTQFHKISMLNSMMEYVQLKGILRRMSMVGNGPKKRLVGTFRDDSGAIELIWFKGASWLQRSLVVGKEYILYGKVNHFNGKLNIAHPELEEVTPASLTKEKTFAPIYPSTEKLNSKGLDSKGRGKIMKILFEKLSEKDFPENLPAYLIQQYGFPTKYQAMRHIHFPTNQQEMDAAKDRLKFEELFFLQLRLLQIRNRRKSTIKGYHFEKIGDYFNRFFNEKLAFELTGAQKRVLKEIRLDLKSEVHMNRLLQGDVGSGKTIVGLMSMLMALDNGYQACMLAPTEILAKQHLISISEIVEGLDIEVAFLSGSVKGKKRKVLLEHLASGDIQILVGTHAILEDPVIFKNLGLSITDEQHRFGVAQRAKLWHKNNPYPPHILVMTATPIPRTLSMTLYGDLDVSVIDELPPGRKEIETSHKTEYHRIAVFEFIRKEIAKGRQIYFVYPLIEESETLDLKNLEEGYEALSREFPMPEYNISIVHGRMKPVDKDFEMQRFVKGETNIMIATTVIEVGVNVPNASVMVIENTERFGLSQLHQLRGRVGRGAEKSYCILMTGDKVSSVGKERISTMVGTNNGFEIAEADMRLRGPGNIEGTQQSGVLNFQIADLVRDQQLLAEVRNIAKGILENDPELNHPDNIRLKNHLETIKSKIKMWSRIS